MTILIYTSVTAIERYHLFVFHLSYYMRVPSLSLLLYEPRHVISNNVVFDKSLSVDSDEPVQPPVKLRNSKCCSVSISTVREYSSD